MSVDVVVRVQRTGTAANSAIDRVASLFRDYIIKAHQSEMIAVNWTLLKERLIKIGDELIRYDMIRLLPTSQVSATNNYFLS